MPAFSFMGRVVLAMMLTVVIVTCGVLWLMSARVEGAYLRLFEERFRAQIEIFHNLQTMRLESLRQRCQTLSISAAVVEALQFGSGELPDSMLQDLQAKARVIRDSASVFDDRLAAADGSGAASGTARTPAASAAEPRRRRYQLVAPDFVDLALVSSLGRVYSLKSGSSQSTPIRWLEDDRISRVPDEQQTGYVMAETQFQFRMPREVILTPVRDPQSGETLGALAVGLPLSSYGENALRDASRTGQSAAISTGLWLEDQLFTSSIPLASQPALKQHILQALSGHRPDAEAAASVSTASTISHRVEMDGQPWHLMLRPLTTDSALPPAWGVMLSSLGGMAAEQKALRNEVLAAAALALGAAFLLSYLLSRGLTGPVRELERGTRRIREGDYAARVAVTRRDELGRLGESFNDMAGGLEQRERYHNILVQLSDKEVARRLIARSSLGGERRDVTVLFCDIRGFTAISAPMPPEEVIAMLNEHMTALTQCVHRHHGVVDKFVGDLIMAVFGVPESQGRDADHAARCALDMMAARRALNSITTHPRLEMGIGLASGPCVAGCMGSENRLNYTVLGERVNLASRLCAAASAGQIVLDSATAAQLGEAFAREPLPDLALKGIPEPVAAYALTGGPAEPAGEG